MQQHGHGGEVRADRHLAQLPQGGRAGAQGGRAPTPRCSSAARAAPARKSSPSSSTTTAAGPAGRWCRSTAPPCPSRCSSREMFGHRKGAFTGADRDKPGLLETANGGTLFLDELTEMSMPLQAKLLRVIQDGVVRRVGQRAGRRGGGRALHLGHQPRPAGGGRAGRPARGPLLPAARGADQAAAAPASGSRTSRCSPPTSSPTTGSATARRATAIPRLSERVDGVPAVAALAGQRARAAERHRARGGAGRAGSADPAGRHPDLRGRGRLDAAETGRHADAACMDEALPRGQGPGHRASSSGST